MSDGSSKSCTCGFNSEEMNSISRQESSNQSNRTGNQKRHRRDSSSYVELEINCLYTLPHLKQFKVHLIIFAHWQLHNLGHRTVELQPRLAFINTGLPPKFQRKLYNFGVISVDNDQFKLDNALVIRHSLIICAIRETDGSFDQLERHRHVRVHVKGPHVLEVPIVFFRKFYCFRFRRYD